ncbi:hypothetical protein D026_2306 [Vibrio parahaemolyticus 605]|nr:hypothetical protein D041_3150 [Vibrio parahaemolyticus EKP-008]ETS21567.1 hypothetical protein D033_2991 [Vibrio parahaemolyticus B-265]ETT10897.1 hypothetical protein D026_2306 [Vibrio parahaemolyticus 605]
MAQHKVTQGITRQNTGENRLDCCFVWIRDLLCWSRSFYDFGVVVL